MPISFHISNKVSAAKKYPGVSMIQDVNDSANSQAPRHFCSEETNV